MYSPRLLSESVVPDIGDIEQRTIQFPEQLIATMLHPSPRIDGPSHRIWMEIKKYSTPGEGLSPHVLTAHLSQSIHQKLIMAGLRRTPDSKYSFKISRKLSGREDKPYDCRRKEGSERSGAMKTVMRLLESSAMDDAIHPVQHHVFDATREVIRNHLRY
jgi:hypothetical protein